MDSAADPNGERLCNHVIWLLICVSAALMLARLATVESRRGGTPMLSANDRSRWSTIRALVDEGSYAIDNVIFRSNGKRDPNWYTIDLVKHRGPDGKQHYYSSKPTLLTTLCAAPYWVMNRIASIQFIARPFYVVRASLLLLNLLPMIAFLVLLTRFLGQLGTNPWSRVFIAAVAAFGTPLTTFAVTLNNHLPAAIFAFAGIWLVVAIWQAEQPKWQLFVLAGLSAAMTAACELPALSFLAIAAAIVFWKSRRHMLLGFLPPVLLVGVGILGTNYLAHGTWSTPYAYREDGPLIATIQIPEALATRPGPINDSLRITLSEAGVDVSRDATISVRPLNRGYALWDPDSQRFYALQRSQQQLEVREWGNWYEYDGSYWSSGKKQGVDRGEPSQWIYALHALVGHHGIFSLTPIWLLSIAGAVLWLVRGDSSRRGIALVTLTLTIVCLVFFILLRPVEDRNYGGVSCCFRWTVWLIPFWLVCLIPALDAVERRPWLRRMALLFLIVSVFSASYNSQNPWSHPWLFDYWSHLGWIKY